MSGKAKYNKHGRKRSGKYTITESSAKRTSMNSSGRGWGDGVPLDKGIDNNKDTSLDELYEATAHLYPEDEPTYRVYKDKPLKRVTVNPEAKVFEENPLFREQMKPVVDWGDPKSMEEALLECTELHEVMTEDEIAQFYYGVWKTDENGIGDL